MKTSIGASLPKDLFAEFTVRSEGFPGGKSALIREALRSFFAAQPLTDAQKAEAAARAGGVQTKPEAAQ